MIFVPDADPGYTNVALHKFSNYPSLFFNLNPLCLLTQYYHTRQNTVKYRFCVFSSEKPLGFLTRDNNVIKGFRGNFC